MDFRGKERLLAVYVKPMRTATSVTLTTMQRAIIFYFLNTIVHFAFIRHYKQ